MFSKFIDRTLYSCIFKRHYADNFVKLALTARLNNTGQPLVIMWNAEIIMKNNVLFFIVLLFALFSCNPGQQDATAEDLFEKGKYEKAQKLYYSEALESKSLEKLDKAATSAEKAGNDRCEVFEKAIKDGFKIGKDELFFYGCGEADVH